MLPLEVTQLGEAIFSHKEIGLKRSMYLDWNIGISEELGDSQAFPALVSGKCL